MTLARTFEATHHVDVNVQHVDTKVTVMEEVLQQVDGNVRATQELTHHVDDNMMEIQGGALIFQFLHTHTDHPLLYAKIVMDDLRRSSLTDILINPCG